MIAVQAVGLGKAFRTYENRWYRLQSALLQSGNHSRTFWALRGVTVEVQTGTTLGVIGQNGSGKTTFLQVLAGLLKPNEGQVHVYGRLATLLELGGGFQQDLTGRENIFFSCGLRGFSRSDVAKRIDEIIAFSELEKFIEHPIKHYSTGMLMRLAFATAIHVQPEVMLIDEVFSVGDMAFQHKCARKFRELQSHGTTIVLATHDMAAVKSLCHSALLLDRGQMIEWGHPDDVTNRYMRLVAERIEQMEQLERVAAEPTETQTNAGRHGSGEAQITTVEVLAKDRQSKAVRFGEEVTFRFAIEYFADVPESILGFYVRDRYGNDLIGINTHEEGKSIGAMRKGDKLQVDFKLRLHLRPGSYSVTPGLAYHPTEMRYLDWINNAAVFEVYNASNQNIHGFVWIPNEITIQKLQD